MRRLGGAYHIIENGARPVGVAASFSEMWITRFGMI